MFGYVLVGVGRRFAPYISSAHPSSLTSLATVISFENRSILVSGAGCIMCIVLLRIATRG